MCNHTMDLVLKHFFEPEPSRFRLSADEKNFIKSLAQLSTSVISTMVGTGLFETEMVHKAVQSVANKQTLDTWQIFATQIFWDTQRELGAEVSEGKNLLEKAGKELLEKYKIYLGTTGLDKVGEMHKIFRDDIIDRTKYVETLALGTQFQFRIDSCDDKAPWKADECLGFSLLSSHPALCGIIMLDLRNDYHRISTNLASDQGQILVAAHLYNVAQSTGFLPSSARWTDLEKVIEQQGSGWIFVGKKPDKIGGYVPHLSLTMGLSVTNFAKDYNNPKKGNGSDGHYTAVGMNRRLEFTARFSELSVLRHGNRVKKYSGENKSFKDIATKADMLAKDYLGVKDHKTTLSSFDTLNGVKLAIEKDEATLNFDIMDMYLRYIRLLGDIQVHWIKRAPRGYPGAIYGQGLGMNAVINEMLSHYSGLQHHHPLMFPDAVSMLRQVINAEGSVVVDKAKAQMNSYKLQLLDHVRKTEPSFENQYEDMMPLEARDLFSAVIFQDANGDCRMPFGMI